MLYSKEGISLLCAGIVLILGSIIGLVRRMDYYPSVYVIGINLGINFVLLVVLLDYELKRKS